MADYEPTPEQVEAAAIALSGETREYAFYEYPYSEVDRDRIRTKARAALTAAGPLIAAEALQEAADEDCDPDCDERTSCDKTDLGHSMCGRCEHGEPRHHGEHFRCARIARGEGS